MNRRGFLQSILAAGVAPFVVTTAGVLMPVRGVIVPSLSEKTLEDMLLEIGESGLDIALKPTRIGPLTRSQFRAVLLDEFKHAWSSHYDAVLTISPN